MLRIYTTRPDTLFGATYMVIAPEHPFVSRLTTAAQQAAVTAYCEKAASKSDRERTEGDKQKTGVFTGSYVINPVNEEAVPVWIADYVLWGMALASRLWPCPRTMNGILNSRKICIDIQQWLHRYQIAVRSRKYVAGAPGVPDLIASRKGVLRTSDGYWRVDRYLRKYLMKANKSNFNYPTAKRFR